MKILSGIFILACSLFISTGSSGQDSLYAREIIKTLTSDEYNGRGYVKDGDKKAAEYLRNQYKANGLLSLGEDYFQPLAFPVNTFPSCMEVKINEQVLIPGKDFIVEAGSKTLKGNFDIKVVTKPPSEYKDQDFSKCFVLIDTTGNNGNYKNDDYLLWTKDPVKVAGIIFIEEKKLTWTVETDQQSFTGIRILRSSIPENPEKIKIAICSKFEKEHKTQNVVGYIPGKGMADSLLVITAHYDHLGRMGANTIFPGANDNASGVSMLLNLARYFSQPANRQRYSIVFICFAGEEAGLIGSHYFSEYPLVPLKSIRFLLNLDLLGTGDDGMMVVNGAIFEKEYAMLTGINDQEKYLPSIGKRGKASISDHYWFTEKGVPSFFCYTTGGIKAYHDIYDVEATLPLTRYKEVFQLFCKFISALDEVN